MTLTTPSSAPVPWWVRTEAPWTGEIFDRMALRPDDPEEVRVQGIREHLLQRYEGRKRLFSVAKARIVTRSFQETEGLHPAIRRALAMNNVFREIPVALEPGQLLLGTASSGPNIVDFTPEFTPVTLQTMSSPLSGAEKRFILREEDRRAFEEEIWPYWRTRARVVLFAKEMQRHYPQAWEYLTLSDCYDPPLMDAQYHTIQDYATVLSRGLLEVKKEISGRIAELDAANPSGMGEFDRREQYEAMLLVVDGIIAYAHRNAELAEQLADREQERARRDELLEMARICRKVPAEPAATWWEALQAFHFLRLGTAMAEDGDSHSAGRFDLYMYPYLCRDLQLGRITRGKAQELLECLFLKWNETCNFKWHEGGFGRSNNDKLNLGGTDRYGHDSTNELSFMLLEAQAHVHLNDPNLAMRVHRNTPDDLLRGALEVLRLGSGLPILINDEAIVPGLVSRCGVSLEHARQYGDIGCQENAPDPNMTGADANTRSNAGWFTLPKPVELALFDGVNPTNGVQVGPRTGDPRAFTTMEQFVEAVKTQIEHAVKMNVIANNVNDFVFTRNYPCVYHNLMHPGPRRSGVDINSGGCMYNWTGAVGVGMANAGDMLASIDHLVFQTREVGWGELLGALSSNWEGADDLRRKCVAAPKYGCDDEYADGWAKKLLDMWFDAYESHSTPRGGRFVGGLISIGTYVSHGRRVGATPDGRLRGEPLADSTSPSSYAPALGPTATHTSATRAIDSYRTPNGVTFNQRFNATAVMSRRELSKWRDLVREYVDGRGQSVQYTVVDRETLKQAQQSPDQYRDLIVRVGGYSAVFVELSKEVQDTIIARSEQAF